MGRPRKEATVDSPPVTKDRLLRDLSALGVEPGMTLIVHSSLSILGWVVGGPPTVIRALIAAIGEQGTLAMPAATPLCADPATWTQPKMSPTRLEAVREHLPLFDRRTTPTSLGIIPETFRNWPGTLRSDHPLESVCARGPLATEITREHPLPFSEGPETPFARLHEHDGRILLLGVGFNRCTALHFAESLVDRRRTMTVRFPISKEGRRTWIEVPNVADDNDTHFPLIGEQYVSAGRVRHGHIGEAPAMLLSMRDLVDFAVHYFDREL